MKELIIFLIVCFNFESSLQQDLGKVPDFLGTFSEKVYRHLASQDSSNNFVFSPISLHAALSVLTLGAKNNSATQTELLDLLAEPNFNAKKFEDSHRNLDKYLKGKMNYANSIWLSKNGALSESYKQKVDGIANVQNIDFTKANEAKTAVNKWVELNTGGLIPTLLEQVDPATQCLIVNALFAKIKWTKEFDPRPELNFNTEEGGNIKVDGMERTDKDFAYGRINYNGGNHQVLKIQGKDSSLELVIVLPSRRTGLKAFNDANAGDARNGKSLFQTLKKGSYSKGEVYVTMPKFKISSDVKATEMFQALGLKTIFTDNSELDILENTALKVDKIKHKAVIDVDEKGVKAAAVTSVGLIPLSASPTMVVNRPFLFMLHDNKQQIPIVMGRVINPSKN